MARRPHLPLRRLEGELPRRKRPGFGAYPQRDHVAHGARLGQQLTAIVQAHANRNAGQPEGPPDQGVIMRVTADGYLGEEALNSAGFQILEQRGDNATIVLSTPGEVIALQERSAQYAGPIPAKQANAAYAGLFGPIEKFDELGPDDRIGTALARRGFRSVRDIADGEEFLVDVELWDIDDDILRELYMARVSAKVADFEGNFLSRYRGMGLFIARVRVTGAGLRALLEMKEVAWIDFPPVADFAPDEGAEMTVDELPPMVAPGVEAICIGVIDSGVMAAHPMLTGVVAGAFGVPARLGSDDECRHGTAVAALATFGSLSEQIRQGSLMPRFRIASAKVIDANGKFDENSTIAEIIEGAIRRLHGEFGCRIINISLGDIEHLVGGRPSNWAMTLDNLIRELGIVVTVSAGNIREISHRLEAEGLNIYPAYLLEEEHRLYEPASAVNALVVGSLAHSNGLMAEDEEDVDVMVLTGMHHPSPFSRSGPGFGKGIKPDLAEYGGTAVWMGLTSRLHADRPSCGVLSLNPSYLQSLMEYRHGTSFAAPVAAYKAAVLLEEFPGRSANFIRALMGLSADHPEELIDRVSSENGQEHFRHAGYGVADVALALASDDSRVVMAVEDSLPVDRFAVYEVPIPSDFQTVRGRRHIRVSLAFDPPVRNTRKDYLGVGMNYRLVRGKSAEEVFERFRSWTKEEKDAAGGAFTFEGQSWFCKMTPNATSQEAGTLQVGTYTTTRKISAYGDRYYLVVRCEGRWASALVDAQTFAVAVELWHEAELSLYQQVAIVVNA